ncbi:hypothetical protein OQA88_12174 [Cercophora sp. LCS_1]
MPAHTSSSTSASAAQPNDGKPVVPMLSSWVYETSNFSDRLVQLGLDPKAVRGLDDGSEKEKSTTQSQSKL